MELTLTLPQQPFIMDSPGRVAEKIRLYAAVGMYLSGEISIGAACELAGIDRIRFAEFLKERDIPLQTQTPDELEAEYHRLIAEA